MGNSKTNQTIFTNAKIVPMSGNSDDFEIIEDAVSEIMNGVQEAP